MAVTPIRKKQQPEPAKKPLPPQPGQGWVFQAGKKTLLFGLVLLSVIIGYQILKKSQWSRIATESRYQLLPERIEIPERPEWIRSDVLQEVLYNGGLTPQTSLLDENLVDRLQKAFASHPWVAKVIRIEKNSTGVIVELSFRKPVCMVEIPGGLYPIDEQAVLLPSADFSAKVAREYPRLSGIHPVTEGPVGSVWKDRRVQEAARIAARLAEQWNAWSLQRIFPRGDKPLQDGVQTQFDIYTSGGTRIIWGRAPESADSGDLEADRKMAVLEARFKAKGSLESASDGGVIDLRGDDEFRQPPPSNDGENATADREKDELASRPKSAP